MAYKPKEFDYADYISKNQDEINRINNQMKNFDQTFDHTKDAGWVAANNQLMKDAKIAQNNAVGKMGNRIGAISTSMQTATDSIYADALKNSQNLIGQYKDAAYNKLLNQRNDLMQQEQFDYQKWLNDRNFAYGQYQNDRNLDYQQYLAQQEAARQAEQQRQAPIAAPDILLQGALAGLSTANKAVGGATNTGNLNIPLSKSADAFTKLMYSKQKYNGIPKMEEVYGGYYNYISAMIDEGLQKGNLTLNDAKNLKLYYGL